MTGEPDDRIFGIADLDPTVRALLLAALAGHADEAICVYDAAERVIAWNARYPVLFPEVTGFLKPGTPFADTVMPLLEQQFPEARAPETRGLFLEAALDRHRTVTGPMTYQRVSDGRWVELRMFPLPQGGRFKIWRDVTREVVQAVDLTRFNDAMSNLQVGVALFDADHRLIWLNSAFFGELIGRYPIEPPRIGQPGGRPATVRQMLPILVDDADCRRLAGLGPDEVVAEPLVVETIHGRAYRVQESLSASGLATTWIDITERRRLERSLTAALEAEQQVRQEQRQLLLMLTHEVRGPLAVIDAAAQVLDLTVPAGDDAARGRLGRIRQSARRLVELVEDCLSEDRLGARDLALDPQPIDLGLLLAELDDAGFADDGAAQIDLQAAGDDDLTLTADPALLRIALSNLVENAVKYAGAATPITVTARAAGDGIEIAVADRGPGIAPDDLPHVFDKYFRAARTGSTTGAGLGLYIVRRIVERHGGRVTAASSPAGTCVTIALPRHPATDGPG